jgi:hypothetical protein
VLSLVSKHWHRYSLVRLLARTLVLVFAESMPAVPLAARARAPSRMGCCPGGSCWTCTITDSV